MKITKTLLLVSSLFVLGPIAPCVHGQTFTVLHSFTGPSSGDDGFAPNGSLTLSGSILYGMTETTVFKINTDATGFHRLHYFADGPGDGANAYGDLALSGSTLYGMTSAGGSSESGTVFKVNTDGTGYQLLHSFSGGAGDGASPKGSLTLSGSILYGMTESGGSSNAGTIFQINAAGTGFQLLRSFTGGAGDGGSPEGSLTLSGSTLYGMTAQGGNIGPGGSGHGTVFKINTNGTGFQLLHSFPSSGWPDGCTPLGSPILSGSTLYGMTYQGTGYDGGTVFKMNTDGSGFQVLHAFEVSDGYWPQGSLTLSGSTFYGMTSTGGTGTPCGSPGGDGTVFQMNADGSGFIVLHSFDNFCSHTGGGSPLGSLVLSGSTLYGMDPVGGIGYGEIFSLSISGGCNYSISPASSTYGSGDGSGSVGVTAGSGCSWTASSDATSWLHTSSSGTGNGTVTFTYDANTGTSSRTGHITVGGQTFTVTQAAPNQMAIITVQANPSDGGIVSGGGTYAVGSSQQISASANSGWTFTGWSDGSTDNLYTIIVPASDTTYTANFSQNPTQTAIITVQANPSDGGTVSGGGTYAVGSSQQISASANSGWTFTGWSDGGAQTHTITVPTGGATYIANFSRSATITKLQAKLNFAKPNADSCSLSAILDLGAGYNLTNKAVTVDIGGTTNVTFMLDAKWKGKGANSFGSCKLAYNKKLVSWVLSVKLAKGSWQTPWAAHGLENKTVRGAWVTMPVVVVIGDDAFADERPMLYTATKDKSGTAK